MASRLLAFQMLYRTTIGPAELTTSLSMNQMMYDIQEA
eukprot:CAMPEP_0116007566 /NCGR_PEP_ID=MMETSP0321-20121206/2370_1 /TAXON_ID=163516 /ORGANISM="Leptocylindrus danicus var. danicus, Strain B650" /LENGTH=37 /DNA_ID= /DNA_START= /DNA_END= /DNA_ORIENTATION=